MMAASKPCNTVRRLRAMTAELPFAEQSLVVARSDEVVIVFPAAAILVPLAHGSHAVAVPMLVASEFFAGIGVMLFDVNIGGLMLVVTPQRLRARARGAFRSINFGVRPVGALVGGSLGSIIGLRPTLFIAAVGGTTAFLWLLFSPVRRIRDLPEAVED